MSFFRKIIKKLLGFFGIDTKKALDNFDIWILKTALREQKLTSMAEILKKIIPDISKQEERERKSFSMYAETKRRGLQAFQCTLMLEALKEINGKEITVVDIGDSAGTHMIYLKKLAEDDFVINTLSVNLDQRAIEKIRARGLKAMLCRAEDLDLGDKRVDLFTSFEMVEHLHNPAIFFRRLAKKSKCELMLITVPYCKVSRIGLHYLRNGDANELFAEDEHIFELSPNDWSLLFLHSGWKVVRSKIYYQYPRWIPVVSQVLEIVWKRRDYEGFWGAILKKDTTFSDLYKDWEE